MWAVLEQKLIRKIILGRLKMRREDVVKKDEEALKGGQNLEIFAMNRGCLSRGLFVR